MGRIYSPFHVCVLGTLAFEDGFSGVLYFDSRRMAVYRYPDYRFFFCVGIWWLASKLGSMIIFEMFACT